MLLLWITFVIVAPAGEEIMFRGFLYRGWVASPRAVLPAIVVISAAWAIIHVQYDWFGILQVFLVGLVLGWVRWRSGSTLLTFALHALANAWATLETLATVEWLSTDCRICSEGNAVTSPQSACARAGPAHRAMSSRPRGY